MRNAGRNSTKQKAIAESQCEENDSNGEYEACLRKEVSARLGIDIGRVTVKYWPQGEWLIYIDSKFSGHYPDYDLLLTGNENHG